MNDAEFERTVEDLYGQPGGAHKPDADDGTTHDIELRETRSGLTGTTAAQPGPRASMEAPRRSRERDLSGTGLPGEGRPRTSQEPRPGDETDEQRERRLRAASRGAKDRTREWLAHQDSEGSSVGPPPDPDALPMPVPRPQPAMPPPEQSSRKSATLSAHSGGLERDASRRSQWDAEEAPPARTGIPAALLPGPGGMKSVGPAQMRLDFASGPDTAARPSSPPS
ncbi:uncharacterized protein BXZ73DRAFT_102425 [Epithele typhae]|uniref:uncharacterized protein n=1 Tax=Epithele typhae TaxID=378194 RepID=UPI002007448B|nr:uncharacterized protein BXZ73DRAFT_102425 [Epithele typhae]KAH9927916.1 hypothetical protein BXZ73DRAFT_102425 [Epithele typhae]